MKEILDKLIDANLDLIRTILRLERENNDLRRTIDAYERAELRDVAYPKKRGK